MAHIEDRWIKNGERTELYGKGMRYKARYNEPDGRERAKSYPDKQKKKAEAFLADIEAKKLHGEYIDPDAGKVTFREYAVQWLQDYSGAEVSVEKYERRLRLHINPKLGHLSLSAISSATIRSWNADMKRAGMAPISIRNTKSLITMVLNAAVDDGRIGKNPCVAKTARAPQVISTKVVPWALVRVLQVREALPKRYRAKVDVGAGCGLRQGEICGIAVEDIDEETGMLNVNRQVKLVRGRNVFGLPKFGKTRSVPLPEAVMAALKAHMAEFPPVPVTLPWETRDGKPVTVRLVFTTTYRNAINRNMFMLDIWHRAIRKVGLVPNKADGLHALRHFYASVSLEAGVSIKALAAYLGHTDPGFTLRTYTHLMPESPARTRAAINGVFGYVPSAADGLETVCEVPDGLVTEVEAAREVACSTSDGATPGGGVVQSIMGLTSQLLSGLLAPLSLLP